MGQADRTAKSPGRTRGGHTSPQAEGAERPRASFPTGGEGDKTVGFFPIFSDFCLVFLYPAEATGIRL